MQGLLGTLYNATAGLVALCTLATGVLMIGQSVLREFGRRNHYATNGWWRSWAQPPLQRPLNTGLRLPACAAMPSA
jgi:hypothetical protein